MQRVHLTLKERDAALVASVLSMHVRANASGDVTNADPHRVAHITDRLLQMIEVRGWNPDPTKAGRTDRNLARYGLQD